MIDIYKYLTQEQLNRLNINLHKQEYIYDQETTSIGGRTIVWYESSKYPLK